MSKTADANKTLEDAARILTERRECLILKIAQLESAISCINDQIDKTTQADLSPDDGPLVRDLSIPVGSFSRMKLSTAVQECLRIKNEAMQADEILQFLRAGGFVTDSLGDAEGIQLAKLTEGLRKNTKTFHRLENGAFELVVRK